MPNVTAPTRQMGNGDVVTQFVDSVGTSAVTYTYPKTQEKFIVKNKGPSSLVVVIAGTTQTVASGDKWEKVADFTSFTINAVSGFTAFDAWADEKGSTFDSPEGRYFQSNGGGSGSGGSGVLVYSTLSDLQTALPNGIATPVWVTADNSWYYWTGAVTVAIPTAPTTPTATAGNTQVTLTWGAVSGATGYKVYRNGTLISSPTTNSYTDTSLTNGTSYSYTVSATNTAGESAQSAAASATPTATVTIPATPSAPTATAGDNKVDLAWTAISGATSYKVYRGGTLLASPTTNSYSDTTSVNGTAYSYTVSAVNSAGESAQSSATSATPAALSYVNDASLLLFQANPANNSTIANPDTYFNGIEKFTVSMTVQIGTAAADINLLLRYVFSEDSTNKVKITRTFENKLDAYFLATDSSNSTLTYLHLTSGATVSSTTNYYHLTFVRDNPNITMYIDNVQAAQITNATNTMVMNTSPTTKPLTLGQSGKALVFKNLAYYNRALTTSELTQNYNALK